MKKIFASLLIVFFVAQLNAQTTADKIEALVSAYATNGKFNGVVLVGQKGTAVFEKGYGYKNWEQKTATDPATQFQIGSVTKQFTAAVIMQLQQEKKLSVKDKLSKYFPQFPNGNKITIEHLLTHTSGIYNYTNDTGLMKGDVSKPRSGAQMMAAFKDRQLGFEPGTSWEYSNSGYSMLGYIIEKVTGKPYEKEVRERILQPLGMTASGFDFTNLSTPDKAKGYFSLTENSSAPAPIIDSTIAYSAGSMYSTVGDLYKWERAITTNKILNAESWKAKFTPQKNNYGYGWTIDTALGKTFTAHSGGIHGFTSYLIRFPQDEVAVILLSNGSSPVLGKLAKNIAAIALNQPYDMPVANTAVNVDTTVLQSYIGEYQLAPSFTITVSLNNGQLFGQATNQPAFQLHPKSSSRFFLKEVEAEVEFFKNGGVVTEMILYQNGRELKGTKIK